MSFSDTYFKYDATWDTVPLYFDMYYMDEAHIWVDAWNWAVGAGLINSKSESLLAPKDTATRAEVAAILHRYLNIVTSHN